MLLSYRISFPPSHSWLLGLMEVYGLSLIRPVSLLPVAVTTTTKGMKMRGLEVSLGEEICGHRSFDTSHSSSSNCRYSESRGHRYLDTSHTSSSNSRGCGDRSSMTSHSFSFNYIGCVDIGGSRSEETSHYSYWNRGTIVHVEGRGGYRSLTIQYPPSNQGEYGILLAFSRDTVGGDGVFG